MLKPFRYCVRKQRVWKLPTFLLYHFSIMAAYLISFLPLFLSTRFINTDRTSLLWLRYLYISILFLGAKLLFSVSIFFFLDAKLLCSIYIDMRCFYFILFHFLFVFVFILFEHPWHAIDVFGNPPKSYAFVKASTIEQEPTTNITWWFLQAFDWIFMAT